jgi:hypothetical protein
MRRRTLDLVFAMSKCQVHGYPRSMYSSPECLASFEDVSNFLMRNGPQFEKSYPVDVVQSAKGIPGLFFASVIGDTLLSTVAWAQGSSLPGIDLYDSCIATCKVGERYFSKPSARALCKPLLHSVQKGIESRDLTRNSPKDASSYGPQTV